MQRIDTLKIQAPLDCLTNFDSEKKINNQLFLHDPKYKGGVQVADKHTLSSFSEGSGMNYIEVNHFTNQVKLGMSAKTLKDEYFEGININNIERVVDGFNSLGSGFGIDTNQFIDQAKVYTLDSTYNLKPELSNKPLDYINALNTYRLNHKYHVEPFKRVDNIGLAWNAKAKTNKSRQIFYAKSLELMKSDNKKFLANIKNPVRMLNEAKSILRVERNFKSLKMIRESFGVNDNKLIDILSSNKNPNYELFKKVTSTVEQLEIFKKYDDLNLTQTEKMYGRIHIIESLNYDIDLVYQFIKSKTGGNPSRARKEYRELIMKLQTENDDEIGKTYKLINEIDQLLKIAS